MRLITPETSAHWYTITGEPRYDATLREARKENLLPSVTSITKLWPKGALESWKQTQLVLAALTLPRWPGESEDAFAQRVVTDGQSQAKTTAAWGTTFHDLCERLHQGKAVCPPPEMYNSFGFYEEWFAANVREVALCEHYVASPLFGYGGKLDLLAIAPDKRRALGDIKSRSVKNGKAAYYDEQPMQLIAYGMALPIQQRPDAYFSVIVNRDAPEPPYVKWWQMDEINEAWERFLVLLKLWRKVNNYTPGELKEAA